MSKSVPDVTRLVITTFAPTVWNIATFADAWYADALREALLPGRDARRREIIFAVCCAESYLIECVRDHVLNKQYNELEKFFPSGKKDNISERWKDIIKELAKQKKIPKAQSFGGNTWRYFRDIVDYRNGLVHGVSSRPDSSSQPLELNPMPATQILETMSPGWAAGVVCTLIRDLHASVGTAPPSWLMTPCVVATT